MKTFDEAMAVCVFKVDRRDESQVERGTEAMEAHARRYEALAQEALDNADLSGVVRQLLVAVSYDEMEVESCLFTVFMLGLQVGMEMEKQ